MGRESRRENNSEEERAWGNGPEDSDFETYNTKETLKLEGE